MSHYNKIWVTFYVIRLNLQLPTLVDVLYHLFTSCWVFSIKVETQKNEGPRQTRVQRDAVVAMAMQHSAHSAVTFAPCLPLVVQCFFIM